MIVSAHEYVRERWLYDECNPPPLYNITHTVYGNNAAAVYWVREGEGWGWLLESSVQSHHVSSQERLGRASVFQIVDTAPGAQTVPPEDS